jgi:hypothetical protein
LVAKNGTIPGFVAPETERVKMMAGVETRVWAWSRDLFTVTSIALLNTGRTIMKNVYYQLDNLNCQVEMPNQHKLYYIHPRQ